MVEHRHPLGGEVRNEALLRTAHAIDRRQLDATDSSRSERLQLRRERPFVNGTPLPPPPRPRLRLGGDWRPRALSWLRRRRLYPRWREEKKRQERARNRERGDHLKSFENPAGEILNADFWMLSCPNASHVTVFIQQSAISNQQSAISASVSKQSLNHCIAS
jgi:hypothetical protein